MPRHQPVPEVSASIESSEGIVPIDQYLAQQYRLFLERLPNEDWRQEYEEFYKEARALAGYINGDNRHAFENACVEAKVEFDEYIEEVLYKRSNRVASVQQGGISRTTFDSILTSDEFWKVFCRAIRLAHDDHGSESIREIYEAMIRWMDDFRVKHGINRFPAVVNRLFSGCLPGRISTIAAHGKLNELLSVIDAF
jgi:hypothetical protein